MDPSRGQTTTRFDDADWQALARLRAHFLDGRNARPFDYWRERRMCELYDATFARRIAWKWRAALAEMARRDVLPRVARVLDWGCGSGVASREFLRAHRERHGVDVERVRLWDRSALAREFAAERLREEARGVQVECGAFDRADEHQLLLVSHVLGELDLAGDQELARVAAAVPCVIWLEPGDREISRELVAWRERLRPGRRVLAPCVHSMACGALSGGRERDWCHSFAAPDNEAFTTAFWREFSQRLKIDARSLPYAYFALGGSEAAPEQRDWIRILGRPRLEKGAARFDACDASGLRMLRVLERDAKAVVKSFADPAQLARPFRVEVERDRVRSIEPV